MIKNYGVKEDIRLTDYTADLVRGVLPYEVRNASGNYEPYLPPGEWQKSDDGDSMACVTFGELNGMETEEKRQTGKQFNYSDRWIAKMSDTTRDGNYLWKVADTIREYGLVLESSYPTPTSYTWNEYHADIPEPLLSELKAEGKAWLKKWDFKYEFVDFSKASLIKHLKHGPIVVIIPGHLVLDFYTTEEIIHYFDSYEPWKKETTQVRSAMKIVLTPREKALDPDTLLVNLKYGDHGSQVLRLKRALKRLGWGVRFPIDEGDIYNDALARLVLKFQKAHLSRLSWPYYFHKFFHKGELVDLPTRKVINKVLPKRL